MKLIGAGFGRTGTLSMKQALEELGFDPCYHMQEVIARPQRMRAWYDIVKGGKPDWPAIFAGFQATVDWPACNYVEELVVAYPEAKVVLNVRDPERWYDSVATTIYRMQTVLPAWMIGALPPLALYAKFVKGLVWEGTFGGRFEDRAYAMGVFERHNAWVQEVVPAGKLLVFNVKEGWEPLCAFLDVPVPDTPFPHVNDRETMLARVRLLRTLIMGGFAVGAGIIAWLTYRLLKPRD